MNNIQQQIDIVSRLPDDVLLMKAQRGDPQIPQWAFVSEIDDRTRMRKESEASQQSQPKVAQRVVQEGIAMLQPQGQPMAMQQPMQQPIQGMYDGGVVRMAPGGVTPFFDPDVSAQAGGAFSQNRNAADSIRQDAQGNYYDGLGNPIDPNVAMSIIAQGQQPSIPESSQTQNSLLGALSLIPEVSASEYSAVVNPNNIQLPKITDASGDVTDNPSGALIEDANSFSLQREMVNAQKNAPRNFDESALGRMVAKGTDAVENFSLVPIDYSKFPFTRPPIEGEPLFSNTALSGSLDVDPDKLLNRLQGVLGGIGNASETSDGSSAQVDASVKGDIMAGVSDSGESSGRSSADIINAAEAKIERKDDVSGQGINIPLAENLITKGSITEPEENALAGLPIEVAGKVQEQATGLSQYLASQTGNDSDIDQRMLSQTLMYIGAGLMKNDLAGGIENAAKAVTGIREKQIGRQEKALDRKLQQTYYDTRRTEAQRDRDLRVSTADQTSQVRLVNAVEKALNEEGKNVNSDLVSLKATATKGDPAAIEKLRRREAELRAQYAREIGARFGMSNAIIDRYLSALPSAPTSGSLTSGKYSIKEVK